jgi:hypothetical protein
MRTSTVSGSLAAAAGVLMSVTFLLTSPANIASGPADLCPTHTQAGTSECPNVSCSTGQSASQGDCTGQNAAVLPVPGTVPAIT